MYRDQTLETLSSSFYANRRYYARCEGQVHVGCCSSAHRFDTLINTVSSLSCSSDTQLMSTSMVL